MANRVFQSVIYQMKDAIDRVVGVVDETGEVISCSELNLKLSIFDEPEAGIDLWSFKSLIKVFEKMRNQINGTILIISHQERILNIADKVVVLADGNLKAQGKKDDILPELLNNSGPCSTLLKKNED